MTAQGHPRTRFKREIEGRWLFHAEIAARELGTLSLGEALELVVLYAEVERAKFERAAVRWLGRYLDEGKDVSLLKAHVALAALSELRSSKGKAAASTNQPGKQGQTADRQSFQRDQLPNGHADGRLPRTPGRTSAAEAAPCARCALPSSVRARVMRPRSSSVSSH